MLRKRNMVDGAARNRNILNSPATVLGRAQIELTPTPIVRDLIHMAPDVAKELGFHFTSIICLHPSFPPSIHLSLHPSLQASPSPSPVGFSPMTPGVPSPGGYNPHTPGSNIEQGSSDWVTTDILVCVKDSFMDLMGQTGVIRSVTVSSCTNM